MTLTNSSKIRLRRGLVCTIVASSIAAPAAVAQQDLRMPDTHDAARAATQALSGRTDLRSPDARDAARHAPQPVSSPLPAVTNVPSPSTPAGFDWASALVGAAIAAALLLALLAALTGSHRVAVRRYG